MMGIHVLAIVGIVLLVFVFGFSTVGCIFGTEWIPPAQVGALGKSTIYILLAMGLIDLIGLCLAVAGGVCAIVAGLVWVRHQIEFPRRPMLAYLALCGFAGCGFLASTAMLVAIANTDLFPGSFFPLLMGNFFAVGSMLFFFVLGIVLNFRESKKRKRDAALPKILIKRKKPVGAESRPPKTKAVVEGTHQGAVRKRRSVVARIPVEDERVDDIVVVEEVPTSESPSPISAQRRRDRIRIPIGSGVRMMRKAFENRRRDAVKKVLAMREQEKLERRRRLRYHLTHPRDPVLPGPGPTDEEGSSATTGGSFTTTDMDESESELSSSGQGRRLVVRPQALRARKPGLRRSRRQVLTSLAAAHRSDPPATGVARPAQPSRDSVLRKQRTTSLPNAVF